MTQKITRRQFIQTAGLFGGFALLNPMGLFSPKISGEDALYAADRVSWVPSICNFCSSACDIQVEVKEKRGQKRISKIEGNANSPLNRGKICARGQSGLMQVYDPDRLKQPLIRVKGSKRGEWKFRAATWDEAFDYIAEKLKKVHPWEISMVSGWQYCVSYMQFSLPFIMTLGIPNIVGSPLQHCVAAGHFGTDLVTGNFNIHDELLGDYENARYILFSLNNASIAGISTSRAVRFAEAKRKGAHVVCLDPRMSELAAKADEWLPIKPGTDMAFFLAMLHVLLRKKLYDEKFVRNHTNAPFLAFRDHSGTVQLLVQKNRDGSVAHYYVYDRISERILPVPAFINANGRTTKGQRIVPALRAPKTLFWNHPDAISPRPGPRVPIKTVFDYFIEQTADYSPEWAATITEIPAETIERIATEFGQARPAFVDPGWMGARYHHLIPQRRLQAIIQTLVGGIDRPGGWIMGGEYRQKVKEYWERYKKGERQPTNISELPGMKSVEGMNEFFSDPKMWAHGHPAFSYVWAEQQKKQGKEGAFWPLMADSGLLDAVEGKLKWNGEPYRMRAFFLNAANPMRHYFPADRWKKIFTHENVELVVAVDVLPSDSTLYADVILPNHTYLEREEPVVYAAGPASELAYVTRFRAIDPLFDTRDSSDIFFSIAERLGKFDALLSAVADFSGWDLQRLKKEVYRAKKQGKPINSLFLKASIRKTSAYAEEITGRKMEPEKLEEILREKGVAVLKSMEDLLEESAMPWKIPLPTSSGRLELFSPVLASFVRERGYQAEWDPIVAFVPPRFQNGPRPKNTLQPDEFYFTYGKIPIVSHASTNNNNPILDAIRRTKVGVFEYLWMNATRAKELGLKSGDRVAIKNLRDHKKVTARLFTTQMIRPDTVFLPSAYGSKNPNLHVASGIGTPLNELIPYAIEPIAASFMSQEFTVQVQKI